MEIENRESAIDKAGSIKPTVNYPSVRALLSPIPDSAGSHA
ncbi:hypothetical protein [Rhodanobacter glycinis]|nr:hypothetical protein [Rhodanobacter glycinis]